MPSDKDMKCQDKYCGASSDTYSIQHIREGGGHATFLMFAFVLASHREQGMIWCTFLHCMSHLVLNQCSRC